MEESIEGAEDLASQNKIRYGLQKGGSTEAFFKVIITDMIISVIILQLLLISHYIFRIQIIQHFKKCGHSWKKPTQVSL